MPVSDNNGFAPGVQFRGQPEAFAPGTWDEAGGRHRHCERRRPDLDRGYRERRAEHRDRERRLRDEVLRRAAAESQSGAGTADPAAPGPTRPDPPTDRRLRPVRNPDRIHVQRGFRVPERQRGQRPDPGRRRQPLRAGRRQGPGHDVPAGRPPERVHGRRHPEHELGVLGRHLRGGEEVRDDHGSAGMLRGAAAGAADRHLRVRRRPRRDVRRGFRLRQSEPGRRGGADRAPEPFPAVPDRSRTAHAVQPGATRGRIRRPRDTERRCARLDARRRRYPNGRCHGGLLAEVPASRSCDGLRYSRSASTGPAPATRRCSGT